MKNVYALCGICASRAISSAQTNLLCRTCMHSVASVPPELYHLPRYCTSVVKNGCPLCLHIDVSSVQNICTRMMQNLCSIRGICTFRALSYVQYRIYLSCLYGYWISIIHKTEDGTFLTLYLRHQFTLLLVRMKGSCLFIFK